MERAASELNHQIAGFALVAIAMLAILGRSSQRFRGARYLWPLVLIAMGLFLAAWSDAEIWPRGPLPWTWLIDHDAESRQHKIYAVLLAAMGVVEFLRARGTLKPWLQSWSFPLLAVCGAALLTMHSHEGTSGLPTGWEPSHGIPMPTSRGLEMATLAPLQKPGTPPDGHMHHVGHPPQNARVRTGLPQSEHHHENMTPAMLGIQRQHLTMMVVGMLIALFKFFADGPYSHNKVIPYLWPGAMSFLGLLLVLYRE
jgi:uncharacterized membrane protein